MEIRAGSSWRRAEELLSLVVVVYLAYAPPALTILFDASIEQLLSADAIWAIVQLLSDRLLATR